MKDSFKKVKEFELELLNSSTRKNIKRLRELLADDFIEFASSGLIIDKKDVLSTLPKQEPTEWKVSNLKSKELSNDIILVTYKVKKKNLKDGRITLSLRSSIWKNVENNWQMIFHQGTLLSVTRN